MAKKGLREYRKALSFTKDKWDLKKHEPKESGTTVDDVIEYVRLKMYKRSISNVDTDDDDDDEVVNASNQESNKNKETIQKMPKTIMITITTIPAIAIMKV